MTVPTYDSNVIDVGYIYTFYNYF